MQTGLLKICRSRGGAALVAAVIALIVSQALVATHAAKYGEGPHKHDGRVCVLSLATHNADKAVAATSFVLMVVVAVWRSDAFVAQSERAAIAVSAAHPRGPPSF